MHGNAAAWLAMYCAAAALCTCLLLLPMPNTLPGAGALQTALIPPLCGAAAPSA